MINWELFKRIPWKVVLNQGTTITCANVYHWGVQLCYKHPNPADTLTASAFAIQKISPGKNHPRDPWKEEGKELIGLQTDLQKDEGKL